MREFGGMRGRAALALTLALFALSQAVRPRPAEAGEGILGFDSALLVREDGSVRVREEIRVHAAGNQIKSGIFRDFPLAGPGGRGKVSFDVVSVSLDGAPLKAVSVNRSSDNVRVMMGDRNKRLSMGEHTFILTYDTGKHVVSFDGHDEINWNVTGDKWAFDIPKASCRISLPEGRTIKPDMLAAWTGAKGSRESPVEITRPAENEVLFVLGRRLRKGEHFTAAVGFTKKSGAAEAPLGIIGGGPSAGPVSGQDIRANEDVVRRPAEDPNPPDPEPEPEPVPDPEPAPEPLPFLSRLWLDIRYGYPPLIFLLSLFYYFITWLLFGRDPKPGTIVPLFHPPSAPTDLSGKPMSPAAMEYVRNATQFSERGFTSLFLSLAVKGLCRLERSGSKSFAVKPLNNSDSLAGLSDEERKLYADLKDAAAETEGGALIIGESNGPTFRKMRRELRVSLMQRYRSLWRLNAWLRFLGWWVVTPIGLTINAAMFFQPEEMPFFTAAMVIILYSIRKFLTRVSSMLGLPPWSSAVLLTALAVLFSMEAFWTGEAFGKWTFHLSFLLRPIKLLTMALPFVFLTDIHAPTRAGRALLDRIDGFVMYLETAENNRLAAFNPPDDTPEVFESLLPYAVALGLEGTWCSRFADQLAKGMIRNDNISVEAWSDSNVTSFVDSFNREARRVNTPPSSSSSWGGGDSAFSDDGGGSGSGSGGGGGGGF